MGTLRIEEIKEVETHIDDAIAFLDRLGSYVCGYGQNTFLINARAAMMMAKKKLEECERTIMKHTNEIYERKQKETNGI